MTTDRRFKPANTTGPRKRWVLRLACGHITSTITYSGEAPTSFKCPCNTDGKRRWDKVDVLEHKEIPT